ncbi:amiloride-sensitive sodium channel subunit beta-like [Mytilus trossulus]|uniref:amiloride-sensitive sodium channel subunit beta-like n=1 Tax=Mytilus trossulus TaxID=6551 RepID=UPI003006EC7D
MCTALQLLINVNQSDYVPYIASEAGIRLSIHEHDSQPFLENNGFSVATGFRTDVSLSQKRIERMPGTTLCDTSNNFSSINFENFLSNIGGALGLWIGMSAISFGELLELCFFLMRNMMRRNRAKENLNDVSVNAIGETTDQNITQSVHIDMSIIHEVESRL